MHRETTSIERTITVPYAHRIYFTRSVFAQDNPLLSQLLSYDRRARVLLVIDQSVAKTFPTLTAQASTYLSAQLVREPLLVPGGEAIKSSREVVDMIYGEIERHRICRHSYVLALGGGALLDAVGFAAATAHRGVRHIRMPSTTLSQADGGVGVKNGINAFGKKNFIGAFAPPFAVINDAELWSTLPADEKRAGLIEAIKVALIRDVEFFAEMERESKSLAHFETAIMERAIRRCAELHVQHIAESGDPFEFGSARPLDFGHWAAHKLEQMSGFALAHGPAVALGLALDILYSEKCGMLSIEAANRALKLIKALGFSLYLPLMRKTDEAGTWILLAGLEEFREHLGGELTVTLLSAIGRGVEVHEIDSQLMRQCIVELERRF